MHILACMAASPIWVGLGKPGNVCRNPGERQINEGSHSEKIHFLKKKPATQTSYNLLIMSLSLL